MNPLKWLLPKLLLFLLFHSSISIDTISTNKSIKDGGILVSKRQIFALGFFSPGNSNSRYVGIWYNQVSEQTVVWVANRDNPISDTSGVISINGHGNLVVYKRNGTIPVWSTNVSVSVPNSSTTSVVAQIWDSGNLVLIDNLTRGVLWQSFDYPTHCMLPLMKLGLNRKSGLNQFLTSWKSPDDPGTGNFSYRINPSGSPQFVLYKGSDPYWRSGSWTGHRVTGLPMMGRYIFAPTFVNNQDEVFLMYDYYDVTDHSTISVLVLNEIGIVQRVTWNGRDRRWNEFWSAPKELCDYYGHCGPNSNCDPYQSDKFECTCLPGFEPKSAREWFLRDGSLGCVRRRGASTCQSGEGFVKFKRVKVPDTSMARVDMSSGLKDCEERCSSNCSCVAYSSAYYEINGGEGCLTWHGDLLDTRTYLDSGQDFYVRVDATELARWRKNGSLGKKGMTAILSASLATIFLTVCFVGWLIKRKRREKKRHNKLSFSFTTSSTNFEDTFKGNEIDENIRNRDLPFLDLSIIAAATNNFSPDNKLGQGGFGSVYKGVLVNGKEIAVKRLSKYSGQGIEEFKNEITLIAKLQHRNLVRILGCCIKREEKMLIYEYLPNKSLDSVIFDKTKRALLDWGKRFEIICGIARGIVYLHQDSRLRIIHRDLKASNVLLDAAMDPKISDFGMAKIFRGDQIEANTNRVVGTYGYMSPEYAMEGLFSIKSDVYSFGVLLLEIITGRKNSGYNSESPSSSLVGDIWDLWRESRAMEIVDESLGETYPANQVLRCIQIGLLCVQEYATDRPTMSSVVLMLANNAALPSSKKPAFIIRRSYNGNDTWTSEGVSTSVNDVTVSMIQAR